MNRPEFPKAFAIEACPKVLEARHWRKFYKVPGTHEDDTVFAECAFNPAGCGLQCESCDKFLSQVHMYDEEKKFVPLIVKYYKDSEEYEKWKDDDEKREAEHNTQFGDIAAYI